MFHLKIETTNAAFEDAVETLLTHYVADAVLMGHERGELRDINGNPVGSFEKKD